MYPYGRAKATTRELVLTVNTTCARRRAHQEPEPMRGRAAQKLVRTSNRSTTNRRRREKGTRGRGRGKKASHDRLPIWQLIRDCACIGTRRPECDNRRGLLALQVSCSPGQGPVTSRGCLGSDDWQTGPSTHGPASSRYSSTRMNKTCKVHWAREEALESKMARLPRHPTTPGWSSWSICTL